MSLTGRSSLSLKKKDVKEQKTIGVGFKKLAFAHKATLGDSGFNLSSLITPTEMSSVGFTNPSVSELQSANLLFFRNNLKLISSHKGLLQDYLSYSVPTSDRIEFVGFTAEDGEIFTGILDHNARTNVTMVDAAPLVSTGTLAIGVTDYNVGQPFEVNKYSLRQVGAVLAFRNGQIQFRNPGNGTTGGNYQEVHAGGGLGTIIRWNNAPVGQEDNILVVSNGLLAFRPDGSMLAEIEGLAGQIDKIIEVLADVSGQPESFFQSTPNSVDLKAFGDQVLDHEQRVDLLESWQDVKYDTRSAFGSSDTFIPVFTNLSYNKSFGTNLANITNTGAQGLRVTAVQKCKVTMTFSAAYTGTGEYIGISLNAGNASASVQTQTQAQKRGISATPSQTAQGVGISTVTVYMDPGDILRPHAGNTGNTHTAADWTCNIFVEGVGE